MAFNANEHMLKLKGKDYLQVMWRLVWFREDHPDWGIVTEMVSHDQETGSAVFRTYITNEGNIVSTGYGSETKRDFGDYLEKAETKSVGRALAMLGYGTQFAPELDEGERIVDSPVQREGSRNTCIRCGADIQDTMINGKRLSAARIVDIAKKKYGDVFCCECMETLKRSNDERSA